MLKKILLIFIFNTPFITQAQQYKKVTDSIAFYGIM